MPELAYKIETEWLSIYLDTYCDVFFSVEAEAQMVRYGIIIPEVLDVLKNNPVIESEKQEVGAIWLVKGRTCDDKTIQIMLEVETGLIRVNVVEVEKL